MDSKSAASVKLPEIRITEYSKDILRKNTVNSVEEIPKKPSKEVAVRWIDCEGSW
jgi:hypothetical protein